MGTHEGDLMPRRTWSCILLAAILAWPAAALSVRLITPAYAAADTRDLGSARPDSVGVSSERLQRLVAAM
jgi:hypothetical protein